MILDKYTGEGVRISPLTKIGNNVRISDNIIIIYAENVFGEGLQTGHRVTIREKTRERRLAA